MTNISGRPIRPDEVAEVVSSSIPSEVFDIFNKHIALNFSNGHSAEIRQEDIISDLVETGNFTRSTLFNKGYLNVEPAYRKAGWKVRYDKPAYNETYDAYFEFTKA